MLCLLLSVELKFCGPKWGNSLFFKNAFKRYCILPRKTMFHSRDSPRLLICDTELYLEQNDIGFITVAICGGYINKYPGLIRAAETCGLHGLVRWEPKLMGAIKSGRNWLNSKMCKFRELPRAKIRIIQCRIELSFCWVITVIKKWINI